MTESSTRQKCDKRRPSANYDTSLSGNVTVNMVTPGGDSCQIMM